MNTTSTSKADYENIESQIRKDAGEIRKDQNQNFLFELGMIVKNAMMIPKDKKEQGVTEEQLKLTILQLFQKQKRFTNREGLMNKMQYMALFVKATEEFGKIVSADMINKTFEYYTYADKLSNGPSKTVKWSEVQVFDYNSLEMEVMFESYKRGNNANLNYIETYAFLSDNTFRTKTQMKTSEDFNYTKGYGSLLNDAMDHPLIQQVVRERNITKEDVTRPKRKLQKLDKVTLEVIEEYTSVTECTELTGISSSTISNVTCQGIAAAKYLDAGGFKWQWSNNPNDKYFAIRIKLGIGLPQDFLKQEDTEESA